MEITTWEDRRFRNEFFMPAVDGDAIPVRIHPPFGVSPFPCDACAERPFFVAQSLLISSQKRNPTRYTNGCNNFLSLSLFFTFFRRTLCRIRWIHKQRNRQHIANWVLKLYPQRDVLFVFSASNIHRIRAVSDAQRFLCAVIGTNIHIEIHAL